MPCIKELFTDTVFIAENKCIAIAYTPISCKDCYRVLAEYLNKAGIPYYFIIPSNYSGLSAKRLQEILANDYKPAAIYKYCSPVPSAYYPYVYIKRNNNIVMFSYDELFARDNIVLTEAFVKAVKTF